MLIFAAGNNVVAGLIGGGVCAILFLIYQFFRAADE
jgi:hypothetical protein